MPGIVLGPISVSITGKKLVICRHDRRDLPHLTLSWGNRSGQFDLHLTYEHRTGADRHQSLLQIPGQDLAVSLKAHEPALDDFNLALAFNLMKAAKRVRPGWLAKRGYVVLMARNEDFEALLSEYAPKRRGKYRIDVPRLKNTSQLGPDLFDSFAYDPRILKLVPQLDDVKDPLIAVKLSRCKGPGSLHLYRLPVRSGGLRWHCVPANAVQSVINRDGLLSLFEGIFGRLKPIVAPVAFRIIEEMRLEELGFEAQNLKPLLNQSD